MRKRKNYSKLILTKYNTSKMSEKEFFMEVIDVLHEEKKHRMHEMYECNKRLDKIILFYISAVYAVIGLNISGKIKLTSLSSDPTYTFLVFLFIFLNYCILLHGISLSTFSMSLAKFIHTELNKDIYEILQKQKKQVPKSFMNWDTRPNHLSELSVKTRDYVSGSWFLLVFGISIYSISLVDINGFIQVFILNNSSLLSIIFIFFIIIILLFFQTFIIYSGLTEVYLIKQYYKENEKIEIPKIILILSSIPISLGIFILYLLFSNLNLSNKV